MATALFISTTDLVKDTSLTGNIDTNKILPMLKAVQQIELEPVLGTDLYNKISDFILSGTIPEPYLSLKNDYIHDLLIHASMAYYIPYSTYNITNGGASKWTGGDNREAMEVSEVNYLVNKEESLAEMYKKRLIDHLCNNTSLYPEYSTNTGEDISPSKETNRTNWYLN